MWITRLVLSQIQELQDVFPVVAILGARQCGKSSLAKELLRDLTNVQHLDLELPSDIRKLADPELYFEANRDQIICLDEIQRISELFPVLRAEVDILRQPGRFIILGSASVDLIRQSSESLAGRIAYFELPPFQYAEVVSDADSRRQLWIRGGFPDCYLARTERGSLLWRRNFIRTFIERDIPQLGFNIDSNRLRKLLTLCAQFQGQLLNYSILAQIISASSQTVRNHIELMCGTFILRTLNPYEGNVKKRLVKSPKIYIR
ncbi:MAG: ATP-binding protein, partial [Lentisphaeraceae bacterium]|nr:ATP-binding protein [Lentisphaeraceae bacterium]